MKNTFLLILLAFAFVSSCEKDRESRLIGKWNVTYLRSEVTTEHFTSPQMIEKELNFIEGEKFITRRFLDGNLTYTDTSTIHHYTYEFKEDGNLILSYLIIPKWGGYSAGDIIAGIWSFQGDDKLSIHLLNHFQINYDIISFTETKLELNGSVQEDLGSKRINRSFNLILER